VELVLAFGLILSVAVALSGLAHRSILSLAAMFLVAGFVAGPAVLGVADGVHAGAFLAGAAEVALFVVLFTDGLHLSFRDLWESRRLPGRALLLGAPLAFGATVVLAHVLVGLSWMQAFLVAAVLAPTDPVFASALVGREEVPTRLRRLLNVESGLNDGLALPVVIIALDALGSQGTSALALLLEIAAGIVLGLVVPWALRRLIAIRAFAVTPKYAAFEPIAAAILLFAVADLTHANVFLAGFIGGLTTRSADPQVRDGDFGVVAGIVTELVKLSATFLFGASLSVSTLTEVPLGAYLFAVLVLVAIRPAALNVALVGSELDARERLAAAWFGPKGFASIVYALLVRGSEASDAELMFHVVAIAVVLSMLLHSSTDAVVAGRFERESNARR
jgi:NhaP-type Na+/H+ or K+/H+ antiporter